MITGLTTGANYYVRVSAYNALGNGVWATYDTDITDTTSTTLAAATALTVSPVLQISQPPTTVQMWTRAEADELEVTWEEPTSTGGHAITSFTVEWDVVDTFDSTCGERHEQQTVTTTATHTAGNSITDAGTWKITANGVDTACLAWGASAAAVKAALEATSEIGADGVEVFMSGTNDEASAWGNTYTIKFVDETHWRDFPLLATGVGTAGGCADPAAGSGWGATAAALVNGFGNSSATMMGNDNVLQCMPFNLGPIGSATTGAPSV